MPRNNHRHRSDRSLPTDDRAVSEVIGAILMFALLFAVLVLIQLNAVPAANQQVEFEHNKRVHQDFQSLQSGIHQTGTTGSDTAVSIETGISYPPRFFLLNPGPSTGSLRTTGSQWVNISNARADGNVGDYWNGDPVGYTTTGVAYTASYDQLANTGTIYWEHSMLFSKFGNGNVYFDDPTSVVDGRQVRLTLLDGRIGDVGLSTSVELAPISTQTRSVSIEDDGGPITLTLQTNLDRDEWEEALVDEPYATVTGYDAAAETVTISLDQGQTYDLRVSKVRIGTSVTPSPGARYITDAAGNGTSLGENTSQRFTLEVRDEFNNPVSNVPVTATMVNDAAFDDDGIRAIGSDRTNSDGRISFAYDAPENVDGARQVRVRASMGDGTDPGTSVDALERASVDMTVVDSDSSGSPPGNTTGDGVSSINPGKDALRLVGASGQQSNIEMTFVNEAGETKTIDQMRLLFATQNDQAATMQWLQLTGYDLQTGAPVTLSGEPRMELFGDYSDVTDISVQDTQTVELSFTTDKGSVQGDMVAITIVYDDGTVNNYFANL